MAESARVRALGLVDRTVVKIVVGTVVGTVIGTEAGVVVESVLAVALV